MYICKVYEICCLSIAAPPLTPSACQKSNESETRQIKMQKQHSKGESSPVVVDRQSSSPNIPNITSEHGTAETEGERSALLESICKFNRGSLRKVRSND